MVNLLLYGNHLPKTVALVIVEPRWCAIDGSVGNKIGNEFQIYTTTNDDQRLAKVAKWGNGFVVTWESYNQDGDSAGIFAQLFDSDAKPIGTLSNNAPSITSSAVTSGTEDSAYNYIATASDPDVGYLTWSATVPSWLSFNTGTTTLSGTPTNSDVGSHDVVLRVTDAAVPVLIKFANCFPIRMMRLRLLNCGYVKNGDSAYSYTVAFDPDVGDTLTWVPALPSWLSFNTGTATLSDTSNSDVGSLDGCE